MFMTVKVAFEFVTELVKENTPVSKYIIKQTHYLELMKAGYPPIDIKFTDRIAYYNAFDEYHVKHNLLAMEKLFAGYINARLDTYLKILQD